LNFCIRLGHILCSLTAHCFSTVYISCIVIYFRLDVVDLSAPANIEWHRAHPKAGLPGTILSGNSWFIGWTSAFRSSWSTMFGPAVKDVAVSRWWPSAKHNLLACRGLCNQSILPPCWHTSSTKVSRVNQVYSCFRCQVCPSPR